MIRSTQDRNHPPQFHAVGCVCVYKDEILLLQRGSDSSYPNTWGIPTGKVEKDETALFAMIREIFEETHINRSPGNITHLSDYYVVNDSTSFKYTLYLATFNRRPKVVIETLEHIDFRWVAFTDVNRFDLIPDLAACLEAQAHRLFPATQPTLFDHDETYLLDLLADQQRDLEGLVRPILPAIIQPAFGPMVVFLGPPGVGKTTVIRDIATRDPSITYARQDVMLDRDSRQHLYLRKLLSGDNSFAFVCQVEALSNRYFHTISVAENAIVDESIFGALAYARTLRVSGRMKGYEFETFYMLYLWFLSWLPRPKCFVHLTADPDTLRTRVVARKRKIEQLSHDRSYLSMLVQAFSDVALEAEQIAPVKYIDSSNQSVEQTVFEAAKFVDEIRSSISGG